ncbi:MAG: DUF58 domain-containing protein, partial [Phycisphaerae bacterium]|nr:DUF58 domain-containing protein [Phycisphaerae bacterium]
MTPPTPPAFEPFDEAFLRRLQELHLLAKRLASGRRPGSHRSHAVGDGLEFADHRAYAPGDDVRFVDWPYYARMEKLLLRLFHEHSESDVAVLLDASASMGTEADTFVYALRVAAALAYVGMGGGRRVILQPFDATLREPLRTARNREAVVEVLDYLRAQQPIGTTDLLDAAVRFAAGRPTCDTVIVISDMYGCEAHLADALARLARPGCQLSVLHLFAPGDAEPRLAGPLQLRDAETQGELTVHATPELMESYGRQWQQRCQRLRGDCLRCQATYVAARTDLSFERLMLTTLRQAGVL